MGKLAITGGEPVRKKRFDPWPVYTEGEKCALEDVLTNRNWGGQPFPGKHADAFAKKFAVSHCAIRAVREYGHGGDSSRVEGCRNSTGR